MHGGSGRIACVLAAVLAMVAGAAAVLAQDGEQVETGEVSVAGRSLAYRVRMLPVSSFAALPTNIATALTARACLVPQTYQAHRPENVVHGSLEKAGSSDWAVLCSVRGRVSLLVFFASRNAASPMLMAEAALTDRLQSHDPTGTLGFNWGIDPASPKRMHEAQASMAHRPPAPDHDGLAESTLDMSTVYHLYSNGTWVKLDLE